jgi:hypothetical protein
MMMHILPTQQVDSESVDTYFLWEPHFDSGLVDLSR